MPHDVDYSSSMPYMWADTLQAAERAHLLRLLLWAAASILAGTALLAWLRAGEGEGHFYGPGPWPFGITAYAGREDNDLILWLPSINAIVTGDSLSDFGNGLEIQLGGRKHVTRDDVVRRLQPLLDLPIEQVLPAHGEPVDRAALESALA